MILDLTRLNSVANTRFPTSTKKNNFEFNAHQPTPTFILSTDPPHGSMGVTMDDYEKTIESMPNYGSGQNFDISTEYITNRHNLEKDGLSICNHVGNQKKQGIASLPGLRLNKVRTNAKPLSATATRRSPTKTTTSEVRRGKKPKQSKTKEYLWTTLSTWSSKLHKICTTPRSQRLTYKGKTITQYNKKNTLHLNDRPLSSNRPGHTRAPLTNGTFIQLDEALKTSNDIPRLTEFTTDLYPNSTPKYKVHQFTNVFHDYFNDLLVWYNDTLNKNVGNMWDPVKGLENIRIIPEKLAGITREVDLMNQYLTSFTILHAGELTSCISLATEIGEAFDRLHLFYRQKHWH